MFGLLGAMIIYVFTWSIDNEREKQARRDSRNRNISFYYDKRGRQRWTHSGRKRTPKEIYKETLDAKIKQRKNIKDYRLKKILDKNKKEYDLYIIHKDRLSFEEYLVLRLPDNFFVEFEELKHIKNNVSLDKINKIKSNPIYYG